jgi:hypothetical protein
MHAASREPPKWSNPVVYSHRSIDIQCKQVLTGVMSGYTSLVYGGENHNLSNSNGCHAMCLRSPWVVEFDARDLRVDKLGEHLAGAVGGLSISKGALSALCQGSTQCTSSELKFGCCGAMSGVSTCRGGFKWGSKRFDQSHPCEHFPLL